MMLRTGRRLSFCRRAVSVGIATVAWQVGALASLPAAAGGDVAHRARVGDTVPRLSWFYRVRADVIRAANPQLHSDELTPGQTVLIPLADSSVPSPPPVPTTGLITVRPAEPVPRAVPAGRLPEPASAPLRVEPARPVAAVAMLSTVKPAIALPLEPEPSPSTSRAENFPPIPPSSAQTTVIRRQFPEHEPAETPAAGERRSPEFLAAARRLSAQRIAYNGAWTPPGQRSAWAMDCSNTARWLYREAADLELPRTASDQYESLRLANRLWETPRDDTSRPEKLERWLAARLQPGDLLFWENTYKPVRQPDITHVMIFLGRDTTGHWLMAGSQSTQGVSIYKFNPHAVKGGYSAWFGLVRRHGRFVAFGRPLGKGQG